MGSEAIPHLYNIISALQEESITVFYPIAAFAWGIYDYFLTFDDEVQLVWKKRIRSSAWLFLWVRYFGLGALVMHVVAVLRNVRTSKDEAVVLVPRHMPLLASAELVSFVLLWSVQVVLQLRLYAMYMSRRLALFNAALYCVMIPSMLYLWLRAHPFHCKDQKNADSPLVQALRCGRGYQLYWVPAIIFDLWIGGLGCYKFLKRFLRPQNTEDRAEIFSIFLRDSAIHYFCYVAAICIFHLMGSLGHGDRHISMFETANFVVGSRLMLHLRRLYYNKPNEEEAAAEATLSGMRFETRRTVSTRSRVVDETFWGDQR